MVKKTNFILKHKKLVVIIFVVLTLVGVFFSTLVNVNFDMVDYLPANVQSTRALEVMKEEFETAIPNARVMLGPKNILEVLACKEKIGSLPGISSVLWLDDVLGEEILTTTPLSYLPEAIVDEYYQDGRALLSIAIEQGEEAATVADLRELIGPDSFLDGEAVNTAEMQNMTVTEVMAALKIAIPIILVILILATASWLEPFLFLASIGVAIAINMGTSALFGEISFITQTVSPILQLAVSMDYAIFLLHSFTAYRAEYEPVQAMGLAMKRTFSTVAASAATTIIGFCALLFMQFGIGSDLGIHLAKSVLLSLISVMVFLPALALLTSKLIEKTRHRPFLPGFGKVSRVIMKLRIPLLIIALLIVVPSFLGQLKTPFIYGTGGAEVNHQAQSDASRIDEIFGQQNPLVLLIEQGDPGSEAQLSEDLEGLENVTNVISYATAVGSTIPRQIAPQEVLDQFYSHRYSRIIVNTNTPDEGDETFATVQAVLDVASEYSDDYYLIGHSVSLFDMKDVVRVDTRVVNLAAVIGIFLVILLTFRSLSVPVFLVFSIETAIWINLSVAFFTDRPLSFLGYLIVSTVQLGATVDYAILLTNHYLEDRQSLNKKEAMWKALSENVVAIMVSAGILTSAGFALAATSSNQIIKELGLLLGRGTLLSLLMVTGVLPALLVLFDKLILKTTWPGKAKSLPPVV